MEMMRRPSGAIIVFGRPHVRLTNSSKSEEVGIAPSTAHMPHADTKVTSLIDYLFFAPLGL